MSYEASQAEGRAARVIGAAYLLAMIPAIFAEFYVLDKLIVTGSTSATAQNIIAHETLFRAGTALNIVAFSIDVVLITALYVVLERVDRRLALAALLFRLLETGILIVAILNDFSVLRILRSGYMSSFEQPRLDALARLAISAHGDAYWVGLFLFGCGSSIFGYLWIKSALLPRPLALLGFAASIWIGLRAFAGILIPVSVTRVPFEIFGMPIFLFELTAGLWLLFRGVRPESSNVSGPGQLQ